MNRSVHGGRKCLFSIPHPSNVSHDVGHTCLEEFLHGLLAALTCCFQLFEGDDGVRGYSIVTRSHRDVVTITYSLGTITYIIMVVILCIAFVCTFTTCASDGRIVKVALLHQTEALVVVAVTQVADDHLALIADVCPVVEHTELDGGRTVSVIGKCITEVVVLVVELEINLPVALNVHLYGN